MERPCRKSSPQIFYHSTIKGGYFNCEENFIRSKGDRPLSFKPYPENIHSDPVPSHRSGFRFLQSLRLTKPPRLTYGFGKGKDQINFEMIIARQNN